MLAMALLIVGIVAAASLVLGQQFSILVFHGIALWLIGFVWAVSMAGALFTAKQMRAGGGVVARGLGAVQASDRSRHHTENTLLQIVAEVAIASHCARPDVYVLRDESSINSFVVGSLNGDSAIVVTQGALDVLSKDELAALVAHEYAHIANVDVPSNMRLMVALGGLLKLDQLGRLLHSKAPCDAKIHIFKALGFVLRAAGIFGVLCSDLLRLGISRQREFTADEKSVEFLRQAKPLASALYKISQSSDCDLALHTPYAGKIRHLCIHAGNNKSWIGFQSSYHPPIATRINAIDPHFVFLADESGTKLLPAPAVSKINSRSPEPKPTTVFNEATQQDLNDADPYKSMVEEQESANSAGLQPAAIKEIDLSDRAVLMMQDSASSLAAVFALFQPNSDKGRVGYLSAIAFAYNQKFSDSVKHLGSMLAYELAVERMGVLRFASQQLTQKLSPEAKKRVLLNLERLLRAQGLWTLMNYAAVQHLRTELKAEFPLLKNTVAADAPYATQRFLKPYDQMGEEFALLLSLVLESTDLSVQQIDNEYVRLLECYTDLAHPRRTGKESGVTDDLEAAFQLLSMQPHAIRESFVQHCAEICALDNCETGERRSIMQVFSASLGCLGVRNTTVTSWADVSHAA